MLEPDRETDLAPPEDERAGLRRAPFAVLGVSGIVIATLFAGVAALAAGHQNQAGPGASVPPTTITPSDEPTPTLWTTYTSPTTAATSTTTTATTPVTTTTSEDQDTSSDDDSTTTTTTTSRTTTTTTPTTTTTTTTTPPPTTTTTPDS